MEPVGLQHELRRQFRGGGIEQEPVVPRFRLGQPHDRRVEVELLDEHPLQRELLRPRRRRDLHVRVAQLRRERAGRQEPDPALVGRSCRQRVCVNVPELRHAAARGPGHRVQLLPVFAIHAPDVHAALHRRVRLQRLSRGHDLRQDEGDAVRSPARDVAEPPAAVGNGLGLGDVRAVPVATVQVQHLGVRRDERAAVQGILVQRLHEPVAHSRSGLPAARRGDDRGNPGTPAPARDRLPVLRQLRAVVFLRLDLQQRGEPAVWRRWAETSSSFDGALPDCRQNEAAPVVAGRSSLEGRLATTSSGACSPAWSSRTCSPTTSPRRPPSASRRR